MTGKTDLDEYASDSSLASGARQRLPLNVQRALLLEILKLGGIDQFDQQDRSALKTICDRTPSLYGARGSELRKRVSKKIVRWRSLHKQFPQKWSSLLTELGVEDYRKPAAKETQTAEEPAPTRTAKKPTTAEKPPKPPTKPAPMTTEKPLKPPTEPAAVKHYIKPAAMSNNKNTSKC